MPRKSFTAQSTVVPLLRRPEPPADLNEAEAAEWRTVVGARPPEWFRGGVEPLLAQYVRAIVRARALAPLVAEALASSAPDLGALLRAELAVTNTIATLATRMRLTPQSRYTAQSAATAAKRMADGPKPWEYADRRGLRGPQKEQS